MDIAAHQRGLAAIGENNALDIGLSHIAVDDLDRRYQQAFLKNLGGICGSGAGNSPADVRLVGDRAGKCHDVTVGKDGRRESHIGYMRQAAFIGMIRNEHVALPDPAVGAIEIENAADEMPIDRRMKEHGRWNDQAAGAVENNAAEIARLADDCGVAGAIEMIMHLLDEARYLVADDANADGVHANLIHRVAK